MNIAAIGEQLAGSLGAQVQDIWDSLFEFQIDSGLEPTTTTARRVEPGKRLNIKTHHVLQLRTAGMTFSQLPPYADWEAMNGAAMGYWRQFALLAKPKRVNRIVLRYINSMSLPLDTEQIDEYLTAAPPLPGALPQAFVSFLTRSVIPSKDNVATVTLSMEDRASLEGVRVLLDIEAAHQCSIEPSDFDAVSARLAELREFKNDVFFEYLTDKALERYI